MKFGYTVGFAVVCLCVLCLLGMKEPSMSADERQAEAKVEAKIEAEVETKAKAEAETKAEVEAKAEAAFEAEFARIKGELAKAEKEFTSIEAEFALIEAGLAKAEAEAEAEIDAQVLRTQRRLKASKEFLSILKPSPEVAEVRVSLERIEQRLQDAGTNFRRGRSGN